MSTEVKYSPVSHPLPSLGTTGRRRLVLATSATTLALLLWVDLAQDNSHVRNHANKGAELLQNTYNYARETNLHYFSPVDDGEADAAHRRQVDDGCRVQFVFAGTKYNYGQFPTMQSWIRYADSKCPIELIRPNHAVFNQLTPAEKEAFYDSAYLPILQADFMKLLVIYYLGGLVTDLDVEALKPFPNEWTGPDTALATCDVVLGIEVNCYDDECVKTMVRKGQIQNWSMWTRHRRSPFVGDLIEYVVAKYKTFPPHDKNVPVQDVFGSGSITDFVQLYGDYANTTHYEVPTTGSGGTLQTDLGSILRIQKQHEEVCIVGPRWTGGGCSGSVECMLSHHYEGSWRQGR
ncbi:Aste57867_15121 [Aphanomyces stellatus]|uniref:Aste57867_15121 protein n=1 Tax=Aphanomyces stellatus TaxID=120398 RepID=A0A485L481_9STRA|nr:hypothetical protein As57867_015065 [Aphanomyces stellatus]VFT91931.1 Aste57867_15121 [Aphanomyces stellatus]